MDKSKTNWRVGTKGTVREGLHMLERDRVRWEVKWLKRKKQWIVRRFVCPAKNGWWHRDTRFDPVTFSESDLALAKGFVEAQHALLK